MDFDDPTGVRHRLWRLGDEEVAPIAGGVPGSLVIADGHHRYAASLAFQQEMRAAHGPGPWDATLALVSDPEESPPTLFAIHRLTSLRLDDVAGRHELQPFPGDLASLAGNLRPGTVGVAAAEGYWTVASRGSPDTAWLASEVLGGIQEAGAPEVVYEHDLDLVAKAIEEGALAFLLAPIPIRTVIDAALAGQVMPPKSTLFWPKPRTGVVLRDMMVP
jgi:uncharacterized protein (DUF1015 family)